VITTWDDLPAAFPTLSDPEAWLPVLQRHAEILHAAEERVRTTSVGAGEMVSRHFAESLEILRIIDDVGGQPPLIDVGPGGGFPGLVIAAVRRDWQITLVEPLKKRAALLVEAAQGLGLDNVRVEALRAEEAGRTDLRDSAAVVTARAVAPLPELLEYCAPLAAKDGLIVLPKGRSWESEMGGATNALSELGCAFVTAAPMRDAVSATPVALLVRKVAATPERYPRRAGIPRKRPL
jgi:16S rRNA (guanine527-N7)-methyltransferase